ncbi:MAG: hypothetical protein IPL26_21650 [Leptospiraceae bacterium]|nr:hypothetical protein [Leptospiraceae bacterium]
MKTTIEIPDELFRKAKVVASSKGLSFKDVVVHSLESELGNIIDSNISPKKETGRLTRKVKQFLQMEFSKEEKITFPKPQFLRKWDFDPITDLLTERKEHDFGLP